MANIVTTEVFDQAIAAVDIVASAGVGPLHGAKLLLATAVFAPSKTSAIGDITQPTTTTFTPPTLTWSTPFRDLQGDIVTQSAPVTVASADGTAFMCYGIMVADSTTTDCYMSALIVPPLPIPDALTSFLLAVPFGPAAPEEKSPQVIS